MALTPVQLHRCGEEQELDVGPLLPAETGVEYIVGETARKVLTCCQPMTSRERLKVRVTAIIHLPSLLARQGALRRNGGRAVGRGGRRSAVGARRRHFELMSPKVEVERVRGKAAVGKGLS